MRFLLFAHLIFVQAVCAQINTCKFEQIDSLQNIGKRNVFVFIHTDWCKYCLLMKNTTLKDEKIIKQLNDKFLFVELNAEEKKDIHFNEHTFKYKPSGNNTGIHELATQLGTIDGKVSYPAICILNDKNEIIFQTNQFLSSTDLLKIIKGI